jgi:peptidoglycan/xylan/chitin deacetylase (PgdA/CDA1 family)
MKRLLRFSALLALATASVAAEFSWPAEGQKSAIVLTYDDALHSQLDIAIPQLEAANLRGTFFLDGDLTPDDMLRWRQAQARGHELGNHSMFHPCPRVMLPDRRNYFTENYDADRMLAEIAAMNNVLFGIDGRNTRTYSVPCSQTLLADGDYVEALRRSGLVKHARTGGDQWNSVIKDVPALDLFRVPSYGPVNRPGATELIAYVDRVRAAGGIGVFQFHGVGGDYLDVSAEAHRELIEHLRKHPDVWVATFREVMDYVSSHSR